MPLQLGEPRQLGFFCCTSGLSMLSYSVILVVVFIEDFQMTLSRQHDMEGGCCGD